MANMHVYLKLVMRRIHWRRINDYMLLERDVVDIRRSGGKFRMNDDLVVEGEFRSWFDMMTR